MKNIRYKMRWMRWLCIVLFSSALFLSVDSFAGSKKKKKQPTAAELMKLFNQQYKAKEYDKAVGTMYRYLAVRDPSPTPGVIRVTQKKRFLLIKILMKYFPDRLDELEEQLEIYIDKPLGEYPRIARALLATVLYKSGKYATCVVAVDNALKYDKDPGSRAGASPLPIQLQKIDWSRYKKSDTEVEYSQDTITELYYTKAEAFYDSKQWDQCIEPYQYVVDHTKDSQKSGYALMQMINAMREKKDFDRLSEFIPQLYKTKVRYDIRVNIAMMDVANTLYEEKRYNDALPLFRMIMPREKLLKFQKARLRQMRIDAGMSPEENMKISKDEEALFLPKKGGLFGKEKSSNPNAKKYAGLTTDERRRALEKAEKQRLKNARFGRNRNKGVEKPKQKEREDPKKRAARIEIEKLARLIHDVEGLPPYELSIKYRMANIYEAVERYWEALTFFSLIYQESPKTKIGKASIYRSLEILLQKCHDPREAEETAFAYLKKHKAGIQPRKIIYLFTRYYQKTNSLKNVKKFQPYIKALLPPDANDPDSSQILRYDPHLYYMLGIADLVAYEFNAAEQSFQAVMDKFPSTSESNTSLYWKGMAMLYQKKFKEACKVFEAYRKEFPEGKWVKKAMYREGVCKFGLEDYVAASNRFNYIISNYSSSDTNSAKYTSIFSDACNLRGDLRGAVGALVDAEMDYRKAIERAVNEHQAKYAVFKLAAIYKTPAQKNYDGIIQLVTEYVNKYQEKADLAKAMYWIGQSKIQKDPLLAPEVVANYFNTIIRFGNIVHQDGVDMMVDELVKIQRTWYNDKQRKVLLKELNNAVKVTAPGALKLRLRVLISKITKTEDELGKQLLSELSNFQNVPPPVLSVLCNVSLKEKIYKRSAELLAIFKEKYEESVYIKEAYKLRCFALFSQKKYKEALVCLQEVQTYFASDPDMAWAQLKKGEICAIEFLSLSGKAATEKYKQTIKEYNRVFSVPAWRGIPQAKATYLKGKLAESAGDKSKIQSEKRKQWNYAFAYYQRLCYQFKGYQRGYWAAEGYLSCARCLKKLGRMDDRTNVFRAMLYDRYVNKLPQAKIAKKELGNTVVLEIAKQLDEGFITNIVVKADAEILKEKQKEAEKEVEKQSTEKDKKLNASKKEGEK